jgi:hypothetical protein
LQEKARTGLYIICIAALLYSCSASDNTDKVLKLLCSPQGVHLTVPTCQ